MRTMLITGGSRGLGLEFTKQYLKKGLQVFAASRNPARSTDLQQLKNSYDDQLAIYQLDVSDDEKINQSFNLITIKNRK